MTKEPKSWEASFPRAQIVGQDWISCVLLDLADYCREHGLSELEQDLRSLTARQAEREPTAANKSCKSVRR